MVNYQKPMFSEDGERRPLMTAEELHDACLHDAATIVVAFKMGYEFKDCRLNDDGYPWPTSVSRLEFDRPDGWRSTGAIAAIHEAGAMAVAKSHGRGPHRIEIIGIGSETFDLLNDPLVWKVIEALAQFIEDNYGGDGCYGALGTDGHEPGEDSEALKLFKSMGLTPDLETA
jgi:hypothetical protein